MNESREIFAPEPVPDRTASDPAYQWDLTAIFPDDAAWNAALEAANGLKDELAAYEGRLGESGATLLAYMQLSERVSETFSPIYGYASLKSDEDTAVARYQDMQGKAQNLSVALSTAAAFEMTELIEIPEERLERFYAETPELEKYRTAIFNARRMAAHVLTRPEEALLASAGNLGAAPYGIYNLFEGADLKFPDAAGADGAPHQVTAGTFIPLLRAPDRTLRRNAFHALYDTYLGAQNTFAALLNAQMKQLQFFAEARHYDSALAASLDATNVPVPVYTGLIDAVNANLPKLHRYMALRKRLMGLDELHMYDIYTPLVPDADVTISYRRAQELVLDALSVLGEDYTVVLRRAFSEGWIDVYENIGKRSGAYSSGLSRPHPYVLLNHKDTLDCAFTIAHELGHAMHSYLSARHQPTVYSDYVIFVAEVASTVNESLLMQHLLAKTEEPRARAYLLNYFLEQFRTTVYRQTLFAEFELLCGEMTGRGETLTAEALNAAYLELNRRYYGPAVTLDDEIRIEWARVPHFYYNYYVYQYATGFSAAMAISRRILTGGEAARTDYLRFLSSGCSQPPIDLLRLAGADMTTAEPINAALELFNQLMDEMENLLV
ncbi:MAG: oligoendopeptidase F [Oscillospiraceae bacterium]|nr:oligoendopeptidase F [Oscillospiraceae bacterium]